MRLANGSGVLRGRDEAPTYHPDVPPPPHATAPDLLVLHTLRCIGFAALERVADATGFATEDARSELIDLGAEGLVTYTPGDFSGWGITDAGRVADRERIAAELETTGTRATVAAAFDRFLLLNPKLLEICTAWQMQTVGGAITLNDHTDAVYDGRVLDQLTDLHGRADAVLASLAEALSRFQRYRDRLADALDRVNAGMLKYVADDMDSYHTVWFQLHEDLLATLGIPREA